MFNYMQLRITYMELNHFYTQLKSVFIYETSHFQVDHSMLNHLCCMHVCMYVMYALCVCVLKVG